MKIPHRLSWGRLPVLLLFLIIVLLIIATDADSNNKRRRRNQRLRQVNIDGDEISNNDYKRFRSRSKERRHLRGKNLRTIPTPQPLSIYPLPMSPLSSSSSQSSSVLLSPASSSSSSPSISIITKGSRRSSSSSSSHQRITSERTNPYNRRRQRSRNRNMKIRRNRRPQQQQQPPLSSTSSSLLSVEPTPLYLSSSSPLPYSREQYEPQRTPSVRNGRRRNARDRTRKNSNRQSASSSRDNRRKQNSPPSSSSSSSTSSSSSSWPRRKPTVRSVRPNIVVIMTDDQDVLLGSLDAMPKLRRLMTRQGVYFNNSFVPTPMCCPSRSTFLTGMYVHNHNVYTNNDNCSSISWQQKHESRGFATYINETYNTGYFGKYLNEYTGTHTPAGWNRWEGLVKNTRYYNYWTVNERGERTRHGDNYYKDYLTDLVANDSCTFLQDSKKRFPDKPVMMMLSLPAPHGPEDAAPQYQHMFVNNSWHRTPTWNYAPNPDKQWLLQRTQKMIPQHKLFTDLLQRRRLQTLQSVDDLVEKVIDQLSLLGELSNTYIMYTSDHGYHLGQFGLIKGKAMPFDFDTRVPLIMRGPGIRPGSVISNIVSNIDIGPTIIDMAGSSVPEHMDGQSVLRLIRAARDRNNVDSRGFVTPNKPWRDSILLEKGKLTRGRLRMRARKEEMVFLNQMAKGGSYHEALNFYIPQKTQTLAMECARGGNRLPCKPKQKYYCIETNGKLRKHKCRNLKSPNKAGTQTVVQGDAPHNSNRSCSCSGNSGGGVLKQKRKERRRHRKLMKRQGEREFQARFKRVRRSVLTRLPVTTGDVDTSSQVEAGFNGFESMFNRRCRILSNQSVLCDLDIYRKAEEWASHKERIDDMIKEYRKALEDLRDIRRHLIKQRPVDASYDADADDVNGVDGLSECNCDEGDDRDGSGLDGAILDAGSGTLSFGGKKSPLETRRPLTRQERRKQRKRMRKVNRKGAPVNPRPCKVVGMQCFSHNNDHWKTPPYWTYGPFCFCPNTANNTYWCLRTINQTHDFHYCEFLTTFMSYYDLLTDPFQTKNTVTELNYGILQQLHEELKKLRDCEGAKECTLRSGQKNRLPHDPNWPGMIHLKRSWRLSKAFKYKYKDNYYDHPDKNDDEDENEDEEDDMEEDEMEEAEEEGYYEEEEEEDYYDEDGSSPDYE